METRYNDNTATTALSNRVLR